MYERVSLISRVRDEAKGNSPPLDPGPLLTRLSTIFFPRFPPMISTGPPSIRGGKFSLSLCLTERTSVRGRVVPYANSFYCRGTESRPDVDPCKRPSSLPALISFMPSAPTPSAPGHLYLLPALITANCPCRTRIMSFPHEQHFSEIFAR